MDAAAFISGAVVGTGVSECGGAVLRRGRCDLINIKAYLDLFRMLVFGRYHAFT